MAVIWVFLLLCVFLVWFRVLAEMEKDLVIHKVTNSVENDAAIANEILDARSTFLHVDLHFERFKKKFGKEYSSYVGHVHRFAIFRKNLLRALEHQKFDRSAVHGITQFSNLTEWEFRDRYLGLRSQPSFLKSTEIQVPLLPTNDWPENFDWRDKGAVTGVKNQDLCGSYWAFSATGALEGANLLCTGKLVSLSEQQLVDCDNVCDAFNSRDAGYNGGLMTLAYKYILEAGGLESEEEYPYVGKDKNMMKTNCFSREKFRFFG